MTTKFLVRRLLQFLFAFTIAGFVCDAEGSGELAIEGELKWPGEWVVFAPFVQTDALPDASVFTDIPAVLRVDGLDEVRTAEARRLSVKPGRIVDLVQFFPEQRVGNTAYVFVELDSPADQRVTLGFGADWWMRAWLNGALIVDTVNATPSGNQVTPISMTNHAVAVDLRKGRNVLAIHFVAGRGSSQLAIGGPAEFAAEIARLKRIDRENRLNRLAEDFAERAVFAEEVQATIMAERGLSLPDVPVGLADGALVGLERMPERQFFVEEGGNPRRADIRDTLQPRFAEPVRLLLSKDHYPYEDRHLDAIVWTTPAKDGGGDPDGSLEVVLKSRDNRILARHTIESLSSSGLFFSVGFPAELEGGEGRLEVVWRDGDSVLGSAEAAFHVDNAADVARRGRITLDVLNATGATLSGAPMSVGVPFPRGALSDADNVRLVDSAGNELPLQTLVTARWSRFGAVKWMLCDFTIDLDGGPRQLFLEYGPDISRRESPPMSVVEGDGFPDLDAGRIRVADGAVQFARSPQLPHEVVLSPAALSGAFVQRGDGRRYQMLATTPGVVEQSGPVKTLVRRTGWYVDVDSGDRFCQFVTRTIFYRDSPLVRIFHTWIFTGDGNADTIPEMGWRFDTAAAPQQDVILSAFEDGAWLDSRMLVQYDFDSYLLSDGSQIEGGRAPGVLGLTVNDTRLVFGVRDFWQNFPSELEIDDDGFTFYNWPRHNPPATFERPVHRDDAFRLRFAHEGEALSFALPYEYTEDEIWREATRNGAVAELHWSRHRPETANAQGIARTEEMFLYFGAAGSQSDSNTTAIMQGLNDQTLRAVVDPVWVVATGVFGPVHPRDPARFPEEERIYELVVKAPALWVERLGFYGMWVHGDYPTWSMSLEQRTVSNYRTLRKGHHDYPLKWLPYARSGDPELLKLAENATRQMSDANFNHYASADIDAAVGPDHFRAQGWWDRSLVPWAGRLGTTTRNYAVDSDYLWHAWYMTGYDRARDVALLFGELTQHDFRLVGGGRSPQAILTSYLDMYEATFDPWFLNAAHEVARMLRFRYGDEVYDEHPSVQRSPRGDGHRREDWRMADQKFYLFTRSEAHQPVARNSAIVFTGDRTFVNRSTYQGEGGAGTDVADLTTYAWRHTGDPYYLGRLAAELDYLKYGAYEGDVDYFRGTLPGRGHGFISPEVADGVPYAMAVLAELDYLPDPIHNPLVISAEWIDRHNPDVVKFILPTVYVRHQATNPLQVMFDARGQGHSSFECRFHYAITGPQNFQLEGEGVAPETLEVEAKPGQYRIEVGGRVPIPEAIDDRSWLIRRVGSWYFPLTPWDVPEVIHFEPEATGTPVRTTAQGYWFFVPEGVTEFWVEFGGGLRLSVWNPDGERVWDRSMTRSEWTEAAPERAIIAVPAEQSGKLWRATGSSFTIDPQIPPYFSASRLKWFNPEDGSD